MAFWDQSLKKDGKFDTFPLGKKLGSASVSLLKRMCVSEGDVTILHFVTY